MLSLTNHRACRLQNMFWFNHIISEWNFQFQITVAHFVVSDLHKGEKIFAFFRGSRAGLIELQNTKLEKKKNGMKKKKPAAWDSKDYESENGKYSSHANSGCLVTPQGFPSFFLN